MPPVRSGLVRAADLTDGCSTHSGLVAGGFVRVCVAEDAGAHTEPGRTEGPSMAYQTFALKYRPQTFDDIVGQDHVAITLKNAVREGRVAHGYLFAGPRGTGKTSTARVLAKALSCERGPTDTPCCQCPMCEAIGSGRAMDLIEIDAASNRRIDDIRELIDGIAYAPTQARCKFYILDEAHMLTTEAANALLKTLEEPPAHAYFVLATTEPHNILPTIRSRCQSFEFRPIPLVEIVGALRAIAENEGVQVDDAALGAIARAAGGAMRDAESIFDQVIAYGRGEVTLEIVNSILGVTDVELLSEIAEALASADTEAVFHAVDDVVASGKDISQLLEDLGLYFRDLLRLSLGVTPPAWMQTPSAGQEQMQQQAQALGPGRLAEIIQTLAETAQRLRSSSQQPLLLEVTLANLAASAPGVEPPAQPAQQAQTEDTQQTATEPEASENAPEAAGKQADDRSQADVGPVLAAEDELTVEIVRRHWNEIGERLLAAGHASVLAVISEAIPTGVEGDTIMITFPEDCTWQCEQAEGRYRQAIEQAAGSVFGREINIRCGCATSARVEPRPENEPAADAQQSADNRQEKLVEALKLNFDGEIEDRR